MYEELVGDLRYCAKGDCNGCRRYTKDTRYCNALLRDAADAIEELTLAIEKLTLIAESNERSAARWAETAGKAVEQIPRWISVTERLPEKWTWVLVCFEGADIPSTGFVNSAGDWIGEDMYTNYDVTHWMPLPEPPKGAP